LHVPGWAMKQEPIPKKTRSKDVAQW
jgi:hypothetical protein